MDTTTRPTFLHDLRLFFLLGVTAIILGLFLMAERASLREARIKIGVFEGKLLEAKQTVRNHVHLLVPSGPAVRNPTLLAEKSLRTLVTEATEKVGISRNLESVNPAEDPKEHRVSARVSLRDVRLREIVEFIVSLKNLSAGILDREAMMTMRGRNIDSWRLTLTLEAPMGRPGSPQAPSTDETSVSE